MGNKLKSIFDYGTSLMPGVYFKPTNKIPTINLDESYKSLQNVDFPLSAHAEFEFTADVDPALAESVLGIDLSNRKDITGFTLRFNAPYQEQIRKHKKKRINKKWAKRYGYRTVTRVRQIENVQFRQVDEYECEVLGNPCKFVKPY